MEIEPDDMCCVICGHIQDATQPYETGDATEGGMPICPKCGNDNVGGYECFACWDVWSDEHRVIVLEKQRDKALQAAGELRQVIAQRRATHHMSPKDAAKIDELLGRTAWVKKKPKPASSVLQ